MKKKLEILFGTRPEIIRLSEIIKNSSKLFNLSLINTNQNFDTNLNKIFIKELIPNINIKNLHCKNDNIGIFMADLIKKVHKHIEKNRPDALLILGDTNSALSSLIYKKYDIKIFHLEAGNRCFDDSVPEEVNRKIIDKISDFNLVYSDAAKLNLIREGYHPNNICKTGSPLREVISSLSKKFNHSKILNKFSLIKNEFFLISFHREENLINKDKINKIIDLIIKISKKFKKHKIIVSLHPRSRKNLSNKDFMNLKSKNVILSQPFGYNDYLQLQINSSCVISDSGSLSEESYILDFRAILLRDSTERPEAIDSGKINTVNFNNLESVINIIDNKFSNKSYKIHDYDILNTSEIVLKYIIGKI